MSDTWLIGASGPAGNVFGNLLAYTKVEITGYGAAFWYFRVGGGLEFGIGQALSVFTEVTGTPPHGRDVFPSHRCWPELAFRKLIAEQQKAARQ